ncbi:GNAT family N-acetyltransferase/peptidase C39 family protein [Mariprofundus sp. KV]|uniref:GNAT family N-acetyltransferase/peptidase C39 family protein n=1 Tax=Mariprofundus sp. KV TaxID=2608715 RepID=UPI0015A3D08A|nr:GNAT family N-acetyltransferase/peptidase C39 family protein [Mariprofundus sp. KV]NWF35700.1 GNAT family N-acetyltransferase [Mariprofundus sp. KV]
MIRPATLDDIAALVGLENRCFEIDRLSERSFRHLLTRGHASFFVFVEDMRLLGYSLVLFHQNTSMARLYSLAVLPECRGKGVAAKLINASEADALKHGVVSMRLEVHVNNSGAIFLYRKLGYKEFAVFPDYYEDHAAALRMEKPLAPHLAPKKSRVPFYGQTLEFTCGPASLMMAMKSLMPKLELSRELELRLWREATSIYMTSGHGGCSPFGLALSAYHRGLRVKLYVPRDAEMFIDSVRNEEKREVIRVVQNDFLKEIRRLKIPLTEKHLSLDMLEEKFEKGAIPVLLISAYRLTGDKSPHWVVVSGFDKNFVYIHEPYVDVKEGKSETTCFGIPVTRKEFERMRFYGSKRQYATLLIYKGDN